MRPRLLDLFCGAGGAAMGYHRAGFDVTGVDIALQPRYPFAFVQADALDYLGAHGAEFDAIHASPPCQLHSAAHRIGNGRPEHHDCLMQTFRLLEALRQPWIVENVPGAPMPHAIILCGTQFGLRLRRHRLFTSNTLLFEPGAPCKHRPGDYTIFGQAVQLCGSRGPDYRDASGRAHYRQLRRFLGEGQRAMGIDWMTRAELSQAIPPAYTEYLGRQLLRALEGAR
jgi:DNA (cytosine-5)-methyltransferase 1